LPRLSRKAVKPRADNRESTVNPYVRAQGLGYIPFDVVSTCHPPVEGDTYTVTIFTKGICRHFGGSASSWTLKSSAGICSPRFPFINLYDPVLTPRLHCSETALQFA
jgi:hypothetical protein